MALQTITVGEAGQSRDIAILHRLAADISGSRPGLVWLGGYRSDMEGTKAEALDAWCAENGLACCRHDYSGHGKSGGTFEDGTISRWLEESLAVFDAFTVGPQILIGSSMGGWIALRMAQELKKRGEEHRLHALLLIAPAPDFTQELFYNELDASQKETLERDGRLEIPSEYSDEPYVYTKAFIDDGARNRVMTGIIEPGCRVHILQGMLDPDVPHTHAMKLADHLPNADVAMTLVKDGDHRMSRPQDIELMLRLAGMLADNQSA